ncbi:MHYT domain-containing protein [Methylobacterium sp. D54C]
MIHTGYNPLLVALSIAIAVFAAYTALDLAARVPGRAGPRWAWVGGAAVAMGGGIWAMHFVGMLAFEIGLPAAYDLGLTLLSLVLAIGVTGAAFAWVVLQGTGARALAVAGPLMGLGVAGMHYVGMAAMHVPGNLAYAPAIVVLSVAIAVLAATAALWLAFRRSRPWQKLAAACVMGLAVAGMHYTGMAAATFTAEEVGAHAAHTVTLSDSQQNLALAVAAATFLILLVGMLAASLDQRRVQRRLHRSEERFRAAVQAVNGVMWTTGAQGAFEEDQPAWAALTGQTFAEMRGDGWTHVVHPDDVLATAAAWAEAVRTGAPYAVEHRVRVADGTWRYFLARAMPVRDEGGAVREWVGVHEDITERHAHEAALRDARDAAEEAQAAAEAANRAKSEFLANMSHELRTPLSAIIGYAEMLIEEVEDGAEADAIASDIGKIEGNARHLLGLINDVLDLSKIESGKMEVYADSFAVEPMLRDLAATVASLMTKKRNTLTLELAADLGDMHSDLTKTRQILLNFLSNAAKFTEGGQIHLSARRKVDHPEGDRLVFAISDTGIGMTDEQTARLFQRFEQADSSTTRRFGGTGLGLALTRAFSEMLGGTVSVASRSGAGSTFTLTLPTTYVRPPDSRAEPQPIEIADDAVDAGTGGELILVIDDDAAQRELMTRFLRREGFRVRVAADGQTGLDLTRRLRPRAILLDVMMPGVDGWSVLSQIKADPELCAIPVVMVTAVDQRNLAASLGAADYMLKPVDWTRFSGVMHRYRSSGTNTRGAVLIVEDDPIARLSMRQSLEDDGWSVAEAEDGEQALRSAASTPPQVAVLDLNMPVMDGFTFLRRFRELPGCAATPVMVLTGRTLSAEDRLALRGASQVLNAGDLSSSDLVEQLRLLTLPTVIGE